MSYWSSDVCSSDLGGLSERRKEILMDDNPSFDPKNVYLDLLDGGAATVIPVTPEFWPELTSGARAMRGRLPAAVSLAADIDHWEIHPAGDEQIGRAAWREKGCRYGWNEGVE